MHYSREGFYGAWSALLILALSSWAAGALEPRRVLLIHSFGPNFAPYDTFSEFFRMELVRQSQEPLDIHEVSLESARFSEPGPEGPFVDYVLALFGSRQLDLVVPIGGPAVRFAQKHRAHLFPESPMLLASVDQRHVDSAALTPKDNVVAAFIDPALLVDHILGLLPQTERIVVVIGQSRLERFWLEEIRQACDPFTQRVRFVWLNDLPFDQMLDFCAALPPHSAIFYALLSVDAAGIPHVEERALGRLHGAANAPIFGLHTSQLGRGIVGGPLLPIEELGRDTASAAIRLLSGQLPSEIQTPPRGPGPPIFDWRELQRWHIAPSSLPRGSQIRFRESPFWRRYTWPIILTLSALLCQGLVISLLLASRSKRRRAEQTAREFGGRLIRAQEEERARLARELHDDITQRLARLAIDAGRIESGRAEADQSHTLREIRDGLVALSEDVHSLAYKLHPSLLADLGLADALKAECEQVSRHESMAVSVTVGDLPSGIPQETGLCLYRVTQEALRNAARHARAKTAEVSVRPRGSGLQLAVTDTGVGFDPDQPRPQPSLGLASMRERVRLLGGKLEVESGPGQGTTVLAWVPLNGESL